MSLEVARCRIEAWCIHYNQRRPGDAANLLIKRMMVFLRCSSGFCFYQQSLLFSY